MAINPDIKEVLDELISDDGFLESLEEQDWGMVEQRIHVVTRKFSFETIRRNLINLCWNADIPTDKVNLDYLGEKIPSKFFSSKEFIQCFTTIKIPDQIRLICSGAFEDSYFREIKLNNHITEIDHDAFWNSDIEEMYIPDSVKLVSYRCFAHCKLLKKISLPNKIIIGDNLFWNCLKLETIEFRGTLKEAEKLHLTDAQKLNVSPAGPDVTLKCTDGLIKIKRLDD